MSFDENFKLCNSAIANVITEVKHDVSDFFMEFERRIGKEITLEEWADYEFDSHSTTFGIFKSMISQMFGNYTFKDFDIIDTYNSVFKPRGLNFSEYLEHFTTNEYMRYLLYEKNTISLLKNCPPYYTRKHLAEYLGLLYWKFVKQNDYSESAYFYAHLFAMKLQFPDRLIQQIADKHAPFFGPYELMKEEFLPEVSAYLCVPCNQAYTAFSLGLFDFNYVPNFKHYEEVQHNKFLNSQLYTHSQYSRYLQSILRNNFTAVGSPFGSETLYFLNSMENFPNDV